MYLFDSNILIYSCRGNYLTIQSLLFSGGNILISKISKVEVLGFPLISQDDKKWISYLFNSFSLIDISDSIIDKAVELRLQKKIKLADSTVAASAMAYNVTLVTNDLRDFKNIPGLQLLNPMQ